MRTAIVVAGLILMPCLLKAEDEAIKALEQSAKNIVQVQVMAKQTGGCSSDVYDCYVLCHVVESFKGKIRKGDLIRIRMRLFCYKRTEQKNLLLDCNRLVEGEDSVLFLGEESTAAMVRFSNDRELKPTIALSDYWLGMLRPSSYLSDWLKKCVKKEEAKKE